MIVRFEKIKVIREMLRVKNNMFLGKLLLKDSVHKQNKNKQIFYKNRSCVALHKQLFKPAIRVDPKIYIQTKEVHYNESNFETKFLELRYNFEN